MGNALVPLEVYDTTLRDGAQAEDVSFSVDDKIRIAQKLDELGIQFIEGGWPGANPRDIEFFQRIKGITLQQAKVVAFGSTQKAEHTPENDPNLKALLAADTQLVTIFGKSWTLHVTDALEITLERNLQLIQESVGYLCFHGKSVFYDAEHFFDGFKADPTYALETVRYAVEGGAERIILCDTNGGTMPWEIEDIWQKVQAMCHVPLGIHAHNDAEMAVANTLVAVQLGARQVQGTMNGIGERCGNVNLCSVVANLELKMNKPVLGEGHLQHLRQTSHYVSEIANLSPNKRQAYIGDAAFAHKGGVHIHAVHKNPLTYEHIRPELVGNRQRVLVSDHTGRSGVVHKLEEYGVTLSRDHPRVQHLLAQLKDRERDGYQFEGAEGSFELMVREAFRGHRRTFVLLGLRVIVEKYIAAQVPITEATIKVQVGEAIEHTAAEGDGPVNAIDNALRKALEKFYPELRDVKLLDYKVRVLAGAHGTGSKVRVLIESGDSTAKWGTVGVSDNIIEASWQALSDSIEYKLLNRDQGHREVNDACFRS